MGATLRALAPQLWDSVSDSKVRLQAAVVDALGLPASWKASAQPIVTRHDEMVMPTTAGSFAAAVAAASAASSAAAYGSSGAASSDNSEGSAAAMDVQQRSGGSNGRISWPEDVEHDSNPTPSEQPAAGGGAREPGCASAAAETSQV